MSRSVYRSAKNRDFVRENVTHFERRVTLMRNAAAIFGAIVLLNLAWVQLYRHSTYATMSYQQFHSKFAIPADRGTIYDRNAVPLALSAPTDEVWADDIQIAQKTTPLKEAQALSPVVHLSVEKLVPLLTIHYGSGHTLITNGLSLEDGDKLTKRNLPGILVQRGSARVYPNGELAHSLLGGVHSVSLTGLSSVTNLTNQEGYAGLEYKFQSVLGGQTGIGISLRQNNVNLPGAKVQTIQRSVPGSSVELTLDTPLQYITEQALANQLVAMRALDGVAIVMDVRTGQILADASLVNTREKDSRLPSPTTWGVNVGVPGIQQSINNLPFSMTYEPGSVFKIVPFSAAISLGTTTPTSPYTVPYSEVVGTRVFHDAEHHGTLHLNATQILAASSNIGTYLISKQVGETNLLNQVNRLGFGATTSVNFPGESAGLLVGQSTWHNSDLASLPIGQVDAVTPIQVLDAYNCIANGGVFIEPTLVRATISSTGVPTAAPTSLSYRVFTPTVAQTLNNMLQDVVRVGTGLKAIIPGYAVAGKTGTAAMPRPGVAAYVNGAYNASFVGFAPADHPTLSMIVLLQRPTTSIFGGDAAAPVFQRVMSYALRHYGVPLSGTFRSGVKVAAGVSSDVTR